MNTTPTKALALIALIALAVWVAATGTSPTGLLFAFTALSICAAAAPSKEENQ